MISDIEIARETKLKPIDEIAKIMGIDTMDLEHYGRYIAKVPYSHIDEERVKNSKLILVTAITPTKAGIGKTTVSVGLGLGMARIGKNAAVVLREPSLGPCFGVKGGAAGGGRAQVLPMEKINLHFTGDFHAITSAHNMISALLDNYIYQHQAEGFGMKQILWKRVLDVNDRSLRQVITGLGPHTNGCVQESGFDITPASEIMTILCLSKDITDMERRINNILLGYTLEDKPLRVSDLGIGGAITALLKDAINPNIVQTTENTPAIIHGGPFANIAHGCNSVIATKMAMSHCDYVITEAGFGADLGAEKFFNIKCRKAGLSPALTIIVATLQGLKMHGGVDASLIKQPNIEGVKRGIANLDRHIANLQRFGQSVLVCFNRYDSDSDEEIASVREHCQELKLPFALNNAYMAGGKGAAELARLVVDTIDNTPSQPLCFTYPDEVSIAAKIEAIAKDVYGASSVTFSTKATREMKRAEQLGCGTFPVCIAKTQYSFSQDPKSYGVPSGFNIDMNCSLKPQYNEMLGLSTSDVRDMITYYCSVGKLPQDVDVETMIEEMRPWYDNYCFAEESLDADRVFNTDMVLYYLHNYMSVGKSPKQMIDPNTTTDYNKMRKLINLDRLDGDRKGTIIKIAEEGEIVGQIKDTFPAYHITKPDVFVSLLYYYGMLTMTGIKGTRLRLGIPNNNVRKQYYEYLLEIYQEHAPLKDEYLQDYFDEMAFEGKWEDAMCCIADNYKNNSSVRSAIQGERNIQGFFAAMLSLNGYYLLAPEMEFNHGFCDFFLMPDHRIYHAEHAYIIELKYLPASATPAQAEAQWAEAVEQIHRYAAEPRLQAMLKGTALHKIILQLQGPDLYKMEEVG